MADAAKADFRSWVTTRGRLRVPEITVLFWAIKGLSTAMGEATSDFLVYTIVPEIAVLIGFVMFVISLVVQFRTQRYVAWSYWFAVVMVGVFGTMAADVVHVVLGVPYAISTSFYGLCLIAVFVLWYLTERTLSIHSIDTPRREAFYWAAVCATFAMGTALGDFTATTLHLGYFPSAVLFAVIITIPLLGWKLLRWNAILCFWFAYVVTRPLGASIADWLGKPKISTGLGYGDGIVVLVFGALIVVLVAVLATTRIDVQREDETSESAVAASRSAPGSG